MAIARSHVFARTGDRHLAREAPPPLFAPEPNQITVATEHDLCFVDSLQKRFANALGFLPHEALERLTEMGVVYLAKENNDPAGFVVSRRHLGWQPLMRSITQTAVCMDAQRRHHGLAIVDRIEREARADGILALQACCAVGLDSNEFWKAAGFIPICHMTPENVRAREIICWRKPLTTTVPIWFAHPPKYAGLHGAKPKSIRNPYRSMEAFNDALEALAPTTRLVRHPHQDHAAKATARIEAGKA
ncbi:MAG: hypothetical protein JO270_08305 [Acidobacteriaceae bacterium]|nr:hypothetical protein [Acidobacteriaceae bacterium]